MMEPKSFPGQGRHTLAASSRGVNVACGSRADAQSHSVPICSCAGGPRARATCFSRKTRQVR